MSKTKQTVSRWISDFEQLERMASDARSSLEREQREWAQIRKEDPNLTTLRPKGRRFLQQDANVLAHLRPEGRSLIQCF